MHTHIHILTRVHAPTRGNTQARHPDPRGRVRARSAHESPGQIVPRNGQVHPNLPYHQPERSRLTRQEPDSNHRRPQASYAVAIIPFPGAWRRWTRGPWPLALAASPALAPRSLSEAPRAGSVRPELSPPPAASCILLPLPALLLTPCACRPSFRIPTQPCCVGGRRSITA